MPDITLPPAGGTARQPRGAIKINGTIVAGWTTFEVENNRFRAADTFRAEFAVSELPSAYDASWFAMQTSIMVEIFANEDPADPARYVPAAADSLIYAQVDHMSFDPEERTIEISGRDLTAQLIDTKTSENHQNQTASQVATLLAQRHGLTPVVTATTTPIGQFYEIDHTDINQQQSEWDLLCKLADFENFDVYVKGRELHFEPRAADTGARYAIIWSPADDDSGAPSANVGKPTFDRDLTIAKGVTVEVRSWNAKQKKGFTASWPKATKTAKPGQASDNTLRYHYSIPGLTQDQASLRAQQIYAQIVQHMVTLSAEMPADGALDCSKIVQVSGTGTAFDQAYYPDTVRRSMAFEGGYKMTLSAKNISESIEGGAQ